MNIKNLTTQQKDDFYKAIASICAKYGCHRYQILRLIHLTNSFKGASFVKIKSYNSDKSLQTEIADQLINIGVNYENQVVNDYIDISTFDITTINADNFNYDRINLDGVSVEDFKKQVIDALPLALTEMLDPKKARVSNDIHLNKVLVWNMNTSRLSIKGVQISKEVIIKGEFKKVKSSAKTIAKELINRAVSTRTHDIRRFTLDNLGGLKMKGTELEIGGGIGIVEVAKS